MALRHEYKKGDITKAIVDILSSTWPKQLKRHILLKELLWNIDYPRAVSRSYLLEPPFFSIKAKKEWDYNYKNNIKARTGLIFEHAIPRSILCNKLFEMKDLNYDSIRIFQETYIKRIFITKQENYALDSLGLRSKMPSDWDLNDPWARHKKAKIKYTAVLPNSFSPETLSEHD